MANKGGNPNPQNRGKPTSSPVYPPNFVSPVLAQGNSKSWPTVNKDLAGIYNKTPANPLGIKHASGATSGSKAGRRNLNSPPKSSSRF